VGSGEGSVYTDLTPTFKKAERFLLVDPRQMKDVKKGATTPANQSKNTNEALM